MGEVTFWNGEPSAARRVRVVVADDERFPKYWARDLVGQPIDAVEVTYAGETFYIADDDGSGWRKVTTEHGSSRWGHRTLAVERVLEGI